MAFQRLGAINWGFAAYRDPIERSYLAGDAAKGDHDLATAGNLANVGSSRAILVKNWPTPWN
jgi:hypothetical protein